MYKSLVSAALIAGSVAFAQAADLPVKAPSMFSPVPVANWTGFYVGGFLSGVWGETDTFLSGGGAPITGKPSGFAAGITAGYDWQMPNSNWVFGGNIAAPFLTSVDDRVADPVFPATVSHKLELNWALLFTGRVGYAYGNWLPYVGAGLAVAEGKGTFSSPTGVASDTQTHVGFTVLAGIRYWLAQNWWVALQYNYVDLGSETYTPPAHASRTVGATSNSVAGIAAYRF